MATTFCFDRDFDSRDQWIGGREMALMQAPAPCESTHHEIDDLSGSVEFIELDVPAKSGSYDPDWRHARHSGKPMTLRSWRDPRFVGSKTVIRKMFRRMPIL